jgi:hypothetical protein
LSGIPKSAADAKPSDGQKARLNGTADEVLVQIGEKDFFVSEDEALMIASKILITLQVIHANRT